MTFPVDDIPFAPPLFEVIDAETFAAIDEPGADPLVTSEGGCVIPVDGFVLAYGDGGAGKTTLCLDWAIHWAAGLPWLGILEPARPLGVLVVENEGPRPEFRRKLRRRFAAWREPLGGRLQILSEPWATLTLRDPAHREEFARLLVDVDLVVAGPLSALGTEGGGTLDEIRLFEGFMKKVRELAARPVSFALVHHENRAGQVSGAWERAPDTLVHVMADGHGRTRVHWQKVRWCSPLHKTTAQLAWAHGDSFTVVEREEITEDTMAEALLDAARAIPGGSWRKFREHEGVKGNVTDLAAVRDRLLAAGHLVNRPSRTGHFNLWAADDPATPTLTGSELRTALEPPGSPSPEREPEPERFPVPDVSRNREQNRNGRPGLSVLDEEILKASERIS